MSEIHNAEKKISQKSKKEVESSKQYQVFLPKSPKMLACGQLRL